MQPDNIRAAARIPNFAFSDIGTLPVEGRARSNVSALELRRFRAAIMVEADRNSSF
jgi:hypothetical protein